MLNWNVELKLWIEILNWNVQLKYSIEMFNWNVQLKCSIEMFNWNVQLKCLIFSNIDSFWNHVCFDRIYWSFWSCSNLVDAKLKKNLNYIWKSNYSADLTSITFWAANLIPTLAFVSAQGSLWPRVASLERAFNRHDHAWAHKMKRHRQAAP